MASASPESVFGAQTYLQYMGYTLSQSFSLTHTGTYAMYAEFVASDHARSHVKVSSQRSCPATDQATAAPAPRQSRLAMGEAPKGGRLLVGHRGIYYAMTLRLLSDTSTRFE